MDYSLSKKINKSQAEKLEKILALDVVDFKELSIKEDEIHTKFEADFENGFHVTIRVCRGQTDCWVDAILFDSAGSNVAVAEPEFYLLGEYYFEFNGDNYCVTLESEEATLNE